MDSRFATRPRAHRDPEIVKGKLARLDEPHLAPLTQLVRRMNRPPEQVAPWFDPDSGGVGARVLFLLENPGPKASAQRGSGFISPDNDDTTAETFFRLLAESGLPRAETVNWNVVPWYQPDGQTRTANATRGDVEHARPWLEQLIQLLPRLRLVITKGVPARDGWMRLLATDPSIPLLPTIAVPHCSPRNLASRPDDRAFILAAMRRSAALLV